MANDTNEAGLTVAVTGPTGTFGFGLVPLLQDDDRISRVVGIARRPFDPAEHGWTKMEYRRGDVREPDALTRAFEGADVVVHLAFIIVGGDAETSHAINVEGTLNAFRAAAAAGARRFVYASSVAAYGFHPDNPELIPEDWPTRPADRLTYAQDKAELEGLLQQEAAAHPGTDLYLLRPPIVVGPHAVGGKVHLSGLLAPLGRAVGAGFGRVPLPVAAPDVPLQLIHEDDVGSALLLCVVAAGPPGAYNIAADDVLSVVDVARLARLLAVPVPGPAVRAAARLSTRIPRMPRLAGWLEALAQPVIMDTTRAKTELGWQPRWSAREAFRDTLR